MKRVITYGSFDLFHFGHIALLKRAKNLGDYLIVGLSSDEFHKSKGKSAFYTYEQRKIFLESCRYVDLVITEQCWKQKIDDIVKFQVDIFVMGDDWAGKFDFLKKHCKVIYLPRTSKISTSEIKAYINLNNIKSINSG